MVERKVYTLEENVKTILFSVKSMLEEIVELNKFLKDILSKKIQNEEDIPF